jgi:hypothetical protein
VYSVYFSVNSVYSIGQSVFTIIHHLGRRGDRGYILKD